MVACVCANSNVILSTDGRSMQSIKTDGLKLNPTKFRLFSKETMFLGHVVSNDGIFTDPRNSIDQYLRTADYVRITGDLSDTWLT